MPPTATTFALLLQTGHLTEKRISNIFKPEGTPAAEQYQIALLALAITALIFVIVAGLLAYTMIRFRRRPSDQDEEPAQVYGSNQIEIAWTFIPILGVFVLIGVTTRFIMSIQDAKLPASAQHVTVVGHQWWWEARYPDYGFVTANEIHIPVTGASTTPVMLKLESSDVIHSFWVPQLSGKTDLVPGTANTMWIDAREPGIYIGNCAEYCGTQHANMLIRVFAEPRQDFEEWVEKQKAGAAAGDSRGREKFESLACVNCHTVRGTAAHGAVGPDLTHLMSRTTIAAGMIVNNAKNLRQWIFDPQSMKPGSLMPGMNLTNEETGELMSYLETLQ